MHLPSKSPWRRHMTSHLQTHTAHAPARSRRFEERSWKFMSLEIGGPEGKQRNSVVHKNSPFPLLPISQCTLFLSSCLLGLSTKCTLPALLNKIVSVCYFFSTLSFSQHWTSTQIFMGDPRIKPQNLIQCRHLCTGNRTIFNPS